MGVDPTLRPVEDGGGLLGQGQGQHHEAEDHQGRHGEHGAVDIDTHPEGAGLVVVLADLVIGIDQIGRTVRRRYSDRLQRYLRGCCGFVFQEILP